MSYPYKYPEPFLQNGRKLYVFDYVAPDGARKRRNTYRDTKKEARQEIRTFLDRLYDPNAVDDEIRRQTFKQYAAPFFVEGKCPRAQRLRGERNISGAVHNEKSRRWLDQYAMKDPFADIPVVLIKRRDILDLRERLLKKTGGEKINTINKVIDSVKTVLSEAYLREDIDRNPGYRIGKLRYDKEEPGILTPEQIRELFKNRPGHFASIQAYDLFYLAAFTAMRSSEVRALPWSKVDRDSKAILVHQAWKNNACTILGLPKWNKKRDIPAPMSLLELLTEKTSQYSVAPGDLVFCHGTGKPLGPTWWRKSFYHALESMGYVKREVSSEKVELTPEGKKRTRKVYKYISETGAPLTPHSLRHSLNTNLLAADANILKVQAFLGWTSNSLIPLLTRVQQGYTHLRVEDLREIAELVDEMYCR